MKVRRVKKIKVALKLRVGLGCVLNMSVFELIVFKLSPKPRDSLFSSYYRNYNIHIQ